MRHLPNYSRSRKRIIMVNVKNHVRDKHADVHTHNMHARTNTQTYTLMNAMHMNFAPVGNCTHRKKAYVWVRVWSCAVAHKHTYKHTHRSQKNRSTHKHTQLSF
eukprot:GDKI01035389.1.p3 GENE.GDKI01035389.1~~GDKI01035389.1.p3  ORF type:complete len:104 (+),score=28.98 GDKI01035389.1:206-517(+)